MGPPLLFPEYCRALVSPAKRAAPLVDPKYREPDRLIDPRIPPDRNPL